MDARSERSTIPLAVDLDGTLIATDLLWEGLFQLLRVNVLYVFMVPFWLMAGPQRLKHEIASRVCLAAADLPYRADVLERLKFEKASGRKLILATGSPRAFADAVAAHLGLFDEVLASDIAVNLTSSAKRDALVARFGDGGFDYAGNSSHDVKIFDAARHSLVVSPDRAAAAWASSHGGERMDGARPGVKTIVKMLRVHQWFKNVLIAVPMVLSHEYFNTGMILSCLLAFVSFSAAASAIYILNDLFDLPLDRRHRTKRNRPFAAGTLSIRFGLMAAAGLLLLSGTCAAFLPVEFGAVLGLYLVATTAYSVSFKRMLLVDVLTLAGLYTLRVLAGAAATGVETSFWLLAFSIFFFLSLSLVKRFTELQATEVTAGTKLAGRGYRPEDLGIIAQAGVSSAFASALVLALYINSADVAEMYARPWMVWLLGPIILYLTLRIWVLANRGEMHEDPVVFLIRDWRSITVCAIGAVLVVAAGA
ncbi:MAG: UbiA family prenyltransferase [Rhizobiaceae bacterium]